jgi:hypothetical protein
MGMQYPVVLATGTLIATWVGRVISVDDSCFYVPNCIEGPLDDTTLIFVWSIS